MPTRWQSSGSFSLKHQVTRVAAGHLSDGLDQILSGTVLPPSIGALFGAP